MLPQFLKNHKFTHTLTLKLHCRTSPHRYNNPGAVGVCTSWGVGQPMSCPPRGSEPAGLEGEQAGRCVLPARCPGGSAPAHSLFPQAALHAGPRGWLPMPGPPLCALPPPPVFPQVHLSHTPSCPAGTGSTEQIS